MPCRISRRSLTHTVAPFLPQVLTSGMWPQTSATTTCTLPRELDECAAEFTQYYTQTHNGGWGEVGAAGCGGA